MATGLIAQRADERFERLLALDAEAGEARLDLAISGVSGKRIASLYPFDFCALLPGVIDYLGPLEWDAYTSRYPSWGSLGQNKARLINGLKPSGLMRLTDELCQRSPKEATLWSELIALLDAKEEAKQTQPIPGLRNPFFYEIVDSFFTACWMMANISEVHSDQEAQDYFLDVSGRLLLEFD